jgi:hypothetical protein
MKRAIRIAMVAILAASITGAKPKPSPLRFTIQIRSEEHCQLSLVTQGLTLQLRLRIVNLGDSLEVQDVGRPGEVFVAKTFDEMKRGIYEVRSPQGEYFDPQLPPNKTAIHLEQGGSFETTQSIGLTVAQQRAGLSGEIVEAGSHYLQVRTGLTVGGTNPLTWRSIPVLSEPILMKVEHSSDAAPCPRNEPDSTPSAPH